MNGVEECDSLSQADTHVTLRKARHDEGFDQMSE